MNLIHELIKAELTLPYRSSVQQERDIDLERSQREKIAVCVTPMEIEIVFDYPSKATVRFICMQNHSN